MKIKGAGYAGVGYDQGYTPGCGSGCGFGGYGGMTSIGAILVLFILLVIISRTLLHY
ncbi:hypothetical protein OIN60_04325 [Paenibacillus sp. P96]|uniref:Sporulation protein YjcZ n=1 Tax=Paenibacillus zeirhizosphaerae TaxID=2987519 RepID=A0ABT9FNN7_9BACL|nr:hypothetical protein [Paenibacillus sp. P96]MDP4096012.1 hypothetical protein [Paenibacillus sp. P96]